MKGKIKSITPKRYKDRDFYEITVDLGDDKSRKYSCWQAHGKDLKEGQEVEFTEESKQYTDNEGNVRTNWKMVLPGGSERKQWGGKTPEQEKKISKHVAFKGAIEIGVSRNLDDDEILRLAEMYFEWLEK